MNNIIPTPKISKEYGGTLVIPPYIHTDHPAFSKCLPSFCESFEKIQGIKAENKKGGIEIVFDPALPADHYVIDINDSAVIYASDKEGAFYGIASALQLFTSDGNGMKCEKQRIEDWPEKDYRGLMLDLSTMWHPAWTINKFIDVCFMFKIKYIHMHFMDNERYTLPSKILPKLSTPSEHYTFEQIREMNEYASSRGIYLIPEVETPGHAESLNRAYPEIFKDRIPEGEAPEMVTETGAVVSPNALICAGRKESFDAVCALIKEIAEMFPESPYIHIGGDEAFSKMWDHCPDCIKYCKEHGLSGSNELYSELTGRLARVVLDNGKIPIVWEGFPKEGSHFIPRETLVIAWESHYHYADDLLAEGFKIINSSWQPLYIVEGFKLRWGPKEILDWNVYNWQHWWDQSRATLNPISVAPTDDVLGAQICSWGLTYEQEINFVMENCAAMCERIWSTERVWTMPQYNRRQKATMPLIALLIAGK